MSVVKVTCLGGCLEIGLNLYIYETETTAVIVDAGIMFEDPGVHGLDSVFPDISYLETIQDKLKALILTHGHEDHIGALSLYPLLRKLPIYTGRFTSWLIKDRYTDLDDVVLIENNQELQIGDFSVTFFKVPHSIPDTFGLSLKVDSFYVTHLSDFKLDKNISIAYPFKTNLLVLDSTNAEVQGSSGSEEEVKEAIFDIVSKAEGRVLFTTFASNIVRVASAVEAAISTGRRIIVEGAAMKRTFNLGSQLGLINLKSEDLITPNMAYKLPPKEVLYILSGCQGEVNGSLYPVAMGERKAIPIEKNDILIHSARAIPGNTNLINTMINSIIRQGGKVYMAGGSKNVHVSGHACSEELKTVINSVNPEYLIPIHGEYRHLDACGSIGINAGLDKSKIIYMLTGEQIIFNNGVFLEKADVKHGKVYYDSRGGFVLTAEDYLLRRQLARDGIVILRNSHIDEGIDVESYGFTLTDEIKILLCDQLNNCLRSATDDEIPEELKRITRRFFKKNMMRRPLIIVNFKGI